MSETTVTVQVKAKIDQFRQQMDNAKQKMSSFSKGAKKDTENADKSVQKFGDRIKKTFSSSQMGKSFNFLASLNPQFLKIQKSVQGIGDGMAKSGAKGKLAMAGGAAALTVMIGGFVAELIKKLWDSLKTIGKMADPIGMEKILGRLQVQINKMVSAMGNAYYPIIEGLALAIGKIAEGLTWVYERLAIVSGFIQGLAGVSVRVNESLRDTADAMEEATETAQEGLAGFDKLTTLGDVSIAGLEESAKIQEMMTDANELGKSLNSKMYGLFALDLPRWGRNAWDTIKNSASSVWSSITVGAEGIWDGLLSTLDDVKTKIVDVFNGAWEMASAGFKTVGNGIIGMLNTVIDSYNGTIGSLSVDIFGQHIGASKIDNLPMLAQGGVIAPNDPHAVIVGDNRREQEVISPISTMKQAFKEALRESSMGGTSTINVVLDGKVVARSVYDPLKQEARRRGKPNAL